MKGEICIDGKNNEIKLTRGAKAIIKEAIIANKTTESRTLATYISFLLEKKYKDDNFDYQTHRMRLESYGQIEKSVDTFIYKYLSEKQLNELYSSKPLYPVNEVVIITPI